MPRGARAEGTVVAEATGILSGGALARAIARAAGLVVVRQRPDGSGLRRGAVALVVRGEARALLGAERAILNVLMHSSGVSTATARAVHAVRGARPRLEIWATRKTLPGLRALERAAVVHGGGHPHRASLADAILVKNNHLRFAGVAEAVRRARARAGPRRPIEVEVRNRADAFAAARAGADALLLDNRTPRQARDLVRALARAGLRRHLWIEISGGLRPSTVARYRGVGANAASLGSLTHSAPALPFRMRLRPLRLSRPPP